jgi:hypothetical protein
MSDIEVVLYILSLYLPVVHTTFLLYIPPSSCYHRETTTYREVPSTHLGTERLIGTQYQWIALWARYSLCAIARDPTQNPYIIETLKRLGILSWSRMRVKLEDQLYFDYPHFPDFKVYWEELTVQSGGVLYDCGP